MAKCEDCGQPLNIIEFLASLFVTRTRDGKKGIHMKTICMDSCEEIEQTVKCGTPYDIVELIKGACDTDDCGNLAVNVFAEDCEQAEQ